MKIRLVTTLGAVAIMGCLAGISHGTTIGFVGATFVNGNLPAGYGSNISGDGIGWTTTDGTGATPDVTLNWPAGPGDWEYHNSPNFSAVESLNVGGVNSLGFEWDDNTAGTTNSVSQTQSGPLQIDFSVPAGIQFVLNSLDIGNAADLSAAEGPYGINLNLVDSGGVSVWSYDTPLFGANEAESVIIGFTGAPGEDYTLNFTRIDDGTPTEIVYWRTGLDNLSFSQITIPEPSSMILGALASLGLLAARKR